MPGPASRPDRSSPGPEVTGEAAQFHRTPLEFARGTDSTGSLFPNPDNAYLEANLVAAGSAADGHTIDELDVLPEDAWISLVVRAGRLVAVSGRTRLQAADEALILADPDLDETIEAIFSKRR